MDLNIEGIKYEFMMFHTDVAEDICDNRPVYLEFKKTDTCYLSNELKFEIPSAKKVEKETHLMAPFVYYIKETNNIMINYIERDIPNEIEIERLGIYLNNGVDYIQETGNENKVCEYFKTAPEVIIFKLV